MNKWFVSIICVIILAISVPFFIDSCTSFQTDDYEYTESAVATAVGVTTANVTLPIALFDAKLTNVNSVSSNLTGEDSVTATLYNSSTYVLTVSGLIADSSRSITVDYKVDDLTGSNAPVGTLASYWPLWLALGGGFIAYRLVFRH